MRFSGYFGSFCTSPIHHRSKPTAMEATKKSRPAPTHPSFKEMIIAAIKENNEKKGSSRQSIRKYIEGNFTVSEARFSTHLNKALKKLIDSEFLVHPKTAPGSYKFNQAELLKKEREEKAKAKAALKKEQEKQKLAGKKEKELEKKKKAKQTIKKAAAKSSTKKTAITKKSKSTKESKKAPKPKKTKDGQKKKTPKKAAIKKVAAKKTPKKTANKKSTKKTSAKKARKA